MTERADELQNLKIVPFYYISQELDVARFTVSIERYIFWLRIFEFFLIIYSFADLERMLREGGLRFVPRE